MEQDLGIDAVLEALRAERGLDFRRYRRSTIERRLMQRLASVRTPDYAAYLALLREDGKEFDQLIRHLTLKVTGFFRNPTVYDLLRGSVLPTLVEERTELSIWSAGCATGEEPFSIAISLRELMNDQGQERAVSIVATDIDAEALEAARGGTYSVAALAGLSPERIARWFVGPEPGRWPQYRLKDEIIKLVHFVTHNLIDAAEPPAGAGHAGFDLVLCRNVLIYFQRSLQDQVMGLLHRSLRPGGYLVLGEAESLPGSLEAEYHCLDRRGRVYHKLLEPRRLPSSRW